MGYFLSRLPGDPRMRFHHLLLIALVARLATAQGGEATRPAGATVSGVVSDSITHLPLAGATVQLVDADSMARFGQTAISDSLGRFTFPDVPDGRYWLGFFHAMLDSLGVEPPLHEVRVTGHRGVRADLGIPSPARLRTAICTSLAKSDSGAVVVGVVRNAHDGAPAAGVAVTGEWLELSFSKDGVISHTPRLVVTTAETGWFAMCNVPSAGSMALTASRGADTTGFIEVQVPASRFLRRDLYLGSARAGDGHLTGVVTSVVDGRPVPGAHVIIVGGSPALTNDRGEWTLMNAPLGTRMLEVRAIGHFPEHRVVDVVEGAAPVRVALFTMKAMLDTMRVTASRLSLDRRKSGFEERRRIGAGHYLTAENIARRHPFNVSDLFRGVPGLTLESDPGGIEKRIWMRGAFGDCEPVTYINSMYMAELSARDIDDWVMPDEVAGMEFYSETTIPAQFRRGLRDCGVIVIWTKH